MKNFAKSNGDKFEKEWQSAFEDAEIQPSSSLWNNIDYELTKEENASYRRRLGFYKMVAAVSTIVLAGLGIYILNNNFEDSNALTVQEGSHPPSYPDNKLFEGSLFPPFAQDSAKKNNKRAKTEKSERINRTPKAIRKNLVSKDDKDHEPSPEKNPEFNWVASSQTAKVTPLPPVAIGNNANLPELTKTIYRVPSYPENHQRDRAVKFLAGINVSPNLFNPQYSQSNGNNAIALNTLSPESTLSGRADLETYLNQKFLESKAFNSNQSISSISYGMEQKPKLSASYGIDFVLNVKKHWTVNSGVNFKQLVATTQTSALWQETDNTKQSPLIVNNEKEVFNQPSGKISISSDPTQVINAFDFVNIPLSFGYQLDFRPFSFEINSGLGANLLITNRLISKKDHLENVNLKPQDTPFRNAYLNGQLSASIGYNLGTNYLFSLSPFYNFALTSLTKSGSNFSSEPRYYGLEFGIKYKF